MMSMFFNEALKGGGVRDDLCDECSLPLKLVQATAWKCMTSCCSTTLMDEKKMLENLGM